MQLKLLALLLWQCQVPISMSSITIIYRIFRANLVPPRFQDLLVVVLCLVAVTRCGVPIVLAPSPRTRCLYSIPLSNNSDRMVCKRMSSGIFGGRTLLDWS